MRLRYDIIVTVTPQVILHSSPNYSTYSVTKDELKTSKKKPIRVCNKAVSYIIIKVIYSLGLLMEICEYYY